VDDLAEYSFEEAIEKVRSGESSTWKCEHRIRARDGKTHWVFESAVELRDGNGIAHGSIGLFQDITERKMAEQALRESENLYRKMNENSPLGMHFYQLTADGQLVFTGANPAADKLLGLDNSQFIGQTIQDAFPPLTQTEVPSRYRGVAAEGIPWSTEQIAYEDDRIMGAFEVSAFQTTPGNMVAVFADVTERKQAEEKINQLNLELEQRVVERTVQLEITNKELEAFSYSVSHDLRAPLRGIDGWSQALLEDYHDQLDEQGKQYIERVRSETQRMGHLIDDMLQLSRLTRAEMTTGPVDLSALAQAIAGRLQAEASLRHVDLNIQAGLTAEGDVHLLEIVLTNLLDNAFKFTAKRAEACIEFGQTELQGQRVFFVRDNGAGFDMTYAQKIFGAFQRMHKVSEFPGTGVGLAIVQRIIHRHGGRVWAEAEVERGTTFYFTLGD
jgi:PAS domain S-box-containing protein